MSDRPAAWRYLAETVKVLASSWKILAFIGIPLLAVMTLLYWYGFEASGLNDFAKQVEQTKQGLDVTLKEPEFPLIYFLVAFIILVYGATKFLRALISAALFDANTALRTTTIRFSNIEWRLVKFLFLMILTQAFFGIIALLAIRLVNEFAAIAVAVLIICYVFFVFSLVYPAIVDDQEDPLKTAKETMKGNAFHMIQAVILTYIVLGSPIQFLKARINLSMAGAQDSLDLAFVLYAGAFGFIADLWMYAVLAIVLTLLYRDYRRLLGNVPTPENGAVESSDEPDQRSSSE